MHGSSHECSDMRDKSPGYRFAHPGYNPYKTHQLIPAA
jgi:hypothetical protein